MKVWCVEDDDSIRDIEVYTLNSTDFEAKGFLDAIAFRDALSMEKPDLIILDIMLPGEDGVELLKFLKDSPDTCRIPVIMATAKTTELDKVKGLYLGADDYITKPFLPLELVARVKSQLRRYTQLGSTVDSGDEAVYTVGGLMINDDLKEVTVDGEPVKLTPMEYNILLLLVKNKGKVFSIDQIYESIWNEDAIGVDNTVAVHIRHIREKI